jgi:hypothetical protein
MYDKVRADQSQFCIWHMLMTVMINRYNMYKLSDLTYVRSLNWRRTRLVSSNFVVHCHLNMTPYRVEVQLSWLRDLMGEEKLSLIKIRSLIAPHLLIYRGDWTSTLYGVMFRWQCTTKLELTNRVRRQFKDRTPIWIKCSAYIKKKKRKKALCGMKYRYWTW